MGTPLTIKGCQFESTFSKGFDAYWMKDGVWYRKAEISKGENRDVLVFKDLQFKQLRDDDNGTYRCALDFSGRQLQLSKSVDVVLEGDRALT